MRSSFCYIHCVDQQPKSGLLRFIVDVSMSLTIMRFRFPLYGRSAPHRGHYLNNTKQTGKKNIHALCGIRTSDPCKQETADLRLRSDGYLDRLNLYLYFHTLTTMHGQNHLKNSVL